MRPHPPAGRPAERHRRQVPGHRVERPLHPGHPLLQRREKVRPIAAQIEAALPPNESLYAVDPDYQPYLFYLRRPIVYASRVTDLPRTARYLLVQPADEKKAEDSTLWAPERAEPILRIKDYRGRRVILLRVGVNPPGAD